MAVQLALDIGTSQTRLAFADGSAFVAEESVVAIDTRDGEVVDVGSGAWRLVSRSPRHVVTFRPQANGTTVDFDVAARLIRAVFDRARVGRFSRVHATMSVPALATSIERRALRQAAMQAGASEVTLIEAPIAAAVGAGLAVEDPIASPVIVLGAGVSETALMSLGGIVTHRSVRIGGHHLDVDIATALRQHLGVVVAPHVAASIKRDLAAFGPQSQGGLVVVPARTVDRGQAVSVEVRSELVEMAIRDHVRSIIRSVQECLGDAPPDLAQDVALRGMTMVGGMSRMRGIDQLIASEVGVACNVLEEPDLTVLRGLLRCVNEVGRLRRTMRSLVD